VGTSDTVRIYTNTQVDFRYGSFYLQIKIRKKNQSEVFIVTDIKKYTQSPSESQRLNFVTMTGYKVDPNKGTIVSSPEKIIIATSLEDVAAKFIKLGDISNGLNELLYKEIKRKVDLSLKYETHQTENRDRVSTDKTYQSTLIDMKAEHFPHQCHELSLYANECHIGYEGQFFTKDDQTFVCNQDGGLSDKEIDRQGGGIPMHSTNTMGYMDQTKNVPHIVKMLAFLESRFKTGNGQFMIPAQHVKDCNANGVFKATGDQNWMKDGSWYKIVELADSDNNSNYTWDHVCAYCHEIWGETPDTIFNYSEDSVQDMKQRRDLQSMDMKKLVQHAKTVVDNSEVDLVTKAHGQPDSRAALIDLVVRHSPRYGQSGIAVADDSEKLRLFRDETYRAHTNLCNSNRILVDSCVIECARLLQKELRTVQGDSGKYIVFNGSRNNDNWMQDYQTFQVMYYGDQYAAKESFTSEHFKPYTLSGLSIYFPFPPIEDRRHMTFKPTSDNFRKAAIIRERSSEKTYYQTIKRILNPSPEMKGGGDDPYGGGEAIVELTFEKQVKVNKKGEVQTKQEPYHGRSLFKDGTLEFQKKGEKLGIFEYEFKDLTKNQVHWVERNGHLIIYVDTDKPSGKWLKAVYQIYRKSNITSFNSMLTHLSRFKNQQTEALYHPGYYETGLQNKFILPKTSINPNNERLDMDGTNIPTAQPVEESHQQVAEQTQQAIASVDTALAEGDLVAAESAIHEAEALKAVGVTVPKILGELVDTGSALLPDEQVYFDTSKEYLDPEPEEGGGEGGVRTSFEGNLPGINDSMMREGHTYLRDELFFQPNETTNVLQFTQNDENETNHMMTDAIKMNILLHQIKRKETELSISKTKKTTVSIQLSELHLAVKVDDFVEKVFTSQTQIIFKNLLEYLLKTHTNVSTMYEDPVIDQLLHHYKKETMEETEKRVQLMTQTTTYCFSLGFGFPFEGEERC